jgi:protein-S-isoprenylcysteine O-methyltransferase Ste14
MTRTDALWLSGQAVLLTAAFVVLPATDGLFGRVALPAATAAGWVLAAFAVGIGAAALLQLGRQLVPQPSPVADGELVTSGLYGLVRHPIYTAVLSAIAAAVVWFASVAGLMLLVTAGVFFDRKAAHEERLLERVYSGYPRYRQQVPARFIPRIW